MSFRLCCASLLLAASAGAAELRTLVVLGPDGQAVARAMLRAKSCPSIRIDGIPQAMALRAPAQTIALRPTQSEARDSKPAAFPVLTCEAVLPAGTQSAVVMQRKLPVPKAELKRLVVMGDTGCRLKRKGNTFQNCNYERDYPFATIARAIAAWKPDAIIHVGDYLYRENACPPGNKGCAGSAWGFGWDAWDADFFRPGRAMLAAAPLIAGRGNHESCSRGGQGYWRFLDPRPLLAGRDCNAPENDGVGDYAAAYAVALGDQAQVIVSDSSNTSHKGFAAGDVRRGKYAANWQSIADTAKLQPYNFLMQHHPLLSYNEIRDKDGKLTVYGGDKGLLDTYASLDGPLAPPTVQAILSGHIHLWEQISFASAHPSQFISGFSGTDEDTTPLPAMIPAGRSPAPGALPDQFSTWVGGFGYMTMERQSATEWLVQVWDKHGKLKNTCQLQGRASRCEHPQVQ